MYNQKVVVLALTIVLQFRRREQWARLGHIMIPWLKNKHNYVPNIRSVTFSTCVVQFSVYIAF